MMKWQTRNVALNTIVIQLVICYNFRASNSDSFGGLRMNKRIAECINILSNFLGKRDISSLTTEAIKNKYGIEQADLMVLFGGSIICGGDVLAEAITNKIAQKYIIVGGAGHTTETLRKKVHAEFPHIKTDGLAEAEIFQVYLETVHGLTADFLECSSTNCGNNITYLLDLISEKELPFHSIILSQDATMQYRMEAGLRKYTIDTLIINYSTYQANVMVKNAQLVYENDIKGMWDMDRYITLLMGEIPRLSDNTEGYGPNGKGYIAHVDITIEVETAFMELKKVYAGMVREANPLYASTI